MTKHFQPKDTAQLLEALQACSDKSLILAGGTDAVIGMRRKGALPDLILFPGGLPGIRDIEVTEDAVTIGAMATMRDTASKLAGIRELAALADACSGVGSAQIRNKATLAGNLCTGSPAGDMLPVAALYGMRLEVLDASGERSMVPFDRFLLGPRKTCLRPGQMVMKLIIDRRPLSGTVSAFMKIGSRTDVSIARESCAALIHLDADGRIDRSRIVLGAVYDTPVRVHDAEKLLIGTEPAQAAVSEAVAERIAEAVFTHCRPANRIYKTEAARGLAADVFARVLSRLS